MDRETLNKAKELKAARDQASAGLVKMEEKKGSVKPAVYQRVRAEYEGKLQEASAKLGELLPKIRAHVEGLLRVSEEKASKREQLAEDIDELTLRHHIGELAEDEYRARRAEMEKQQEEASAGSGETQTELSELILPFKDEEGFAPLAAKLGGKAPPSAETSPAPTEAAEPPAPPPSAPHPGPTPSRDQIEEALGDPFADAGASAGGAPDEEKPFFTNPILLVRTNGDETSYLLDLGELAIGRADDNDIVLDDKEALPKHAIVKFEQDHYVVMTAVPDSQLLVNDKAAKRAALADGDCIRIGTSEITFRNVRFDV